MKGLKEKIQEGFIVSSTLCQKTKFAVWSNNTHLGFSQRESKWLKVEKEKDKPTAILQRFSAIL